MKKKNFPNDVDEVYTIGGEANTERHGKKTIIFNDDDVQAFVIDEEDDFSSKSSSEEKEETIFINLEDQPNEEDQADDFPDDEIRVLGTPSPKRKTKKNIDKEATAWTMSFMAVMTLLFAIGVSCYCATEGFSAMWDNIIHTKNFLCCDIGTTSAVGILLVVLFAFYLMGASVHWMYRSFIKIDEVGFKNALESIQNIAYEIAEEITKNTFKAIKLAFATGIVYFVWNFLREF